MDCEALVILGGGLTGLAVVRSAHRLGLEPVLVLAGNSDDPAALSSYARVTRLVEITPARALATLQTLAQGRATALVATSDSWLRFLLEHRAALAAQFCAILHPDDEALRTCLDKGAFAVWAETHGVSAPRLLSRQALTDAKNLSFPLFLRPTETHHGEARSPLPKALEIRTPSELQDWLEVFGRAGVEALVTESLLRPGIVQFAVGAACREGEVRSFVARKVRPHPQQSAVGTFVELSPHPEVETLALAALERMGYEGMAEVEVLHDAGSGESWIIEINARPWIQYALAYRSGHDFLRFLLNPGAYDPSREVKQGMSWIDFSGDLFNCFSRSVGLVRRGQVPLNMYLHSVARRNVPARFDLRDRGPFWHATARLASTILGRRDSR